MEDDIYEKTHTFKFDEVQIKRILVDLLLLSGEDVPQDVYANLDPEEFIKHEADIDLKCVKTDDYNDGFTLTLSWTPDNLQEFQEAYETELKSRKEADLPQELPENVWTLQNTCDKKCPEDLKD